MMEKTLEKYLAQVERFLKPLPLSQRVDIVQEIKSEICELQAEGISPEGILERLGNPKELAKAYLGELVVGPNALSSWSRFLAFLAFYSLAGFTGMFVIPCLGIVGPVFMFCGIVCPVVGAFKLADVLLGLHLPYMENVGIMVGTGHLNPFLEFFGCVLLGVLLFLAGWACWKLLVRYIRLVTKAHKLIG